MIAYPTSSVMIHAYKHTTTQSDFLQKLATTAVSQPHHKTIMIQPGATSLRGVARQHKRYNLLLLEDILK